MSVSNPKITIILPVYNAERFLAASIESVLSQTFTDFRLLIINDGSTDNSLAIVKKYANDDSRVQIVSRENRGLVASLNEGVALSGSEFIARMDADDIALPDRLERQIGFMAQHPETVFCGAGARLFLSDFPVVSKRLLYPSADETLRLSLLFRCPFVHSTIMMRRDFFVRNQLFYDESFKGLEDYELWTRAVRLGGSANIPKVLLRYRLHKSSVTQSSNTDENGFAARAERYRRLLKSYFSYMQIPVTDSQMKVHLSLVLAGVHVFPSITRSMQEEWLSELGQKISSLGTYSDLSIKEVCRAQSEKIRRQRVRLAIRRLI